MFSKWYMNILAYAGAQIVRMAQPFICKSILEWNTKMFNVKINDWKVVITFVAPILLAKFFKDILTLLIPTESGILTYKDLT